MGELRLHRGDAGFGTKSGMANKQAIFLEGNLLRHISIMSASASIGLVSMFLVDFADLLFISMLGEQELAAAVGFARFA